MGDSTYESLKERKKDGLNARPTQRPFGRRTKSTGERVWKETTVTGRLITGERERKRDSAKRRLNVMHRIIMKEWPDHRADTEVGNPPYYYYRYEMTI